MGSTFARAAPAPLTPSNAFHHVLDGEYENGLYHGVGQFAEEDGSLYSGSWSSGLRCGQGSQVNNRERNEYHGSFMDDLYHGTGKCTWVNGVRLPMARGSEALQTELDCASFYISTLPHI